MNRQGTVPIPCAHRDAFRKFGINRLALIGTVVHNQGQAEGDVEFVVDGFGKNAIEVVV